MTMDFLLNLWLFLCVAGGSIYGVHHFFKPKKALFLQMVTCAVMCIMLARLFYIIYLVTQGSMLPGFHIGMLGMIGSFQFLFSANYGQMDGLVDDGTDAFRMTRIKAFLVPALILLLYGIFCMEVESMKLRALMGLRTFFVMQSAYYNFKHIIIDDVELGIIRSLRKYNMLAVVYAFLTMFVFIGKYGNIRPLYIASFVGIGIVAASILPVMMAFLLPAGFLARSEVRAAELHKTYIKV